MEVLYIQLYQGHINEKRACNSLRSKMKWARVDAKYSLIKGNKQLALSPMLAFHGKKDSKLSVYLCPHPPLCDILIAIHSISCLWLYSLIVRRVDSQLYALFSFIHTHLVVHTMVAGL